MALDRRDFLKLTAAAGLAVTTPLALSSTSSAQADYDGPLWVLVNAAGGWDPTLLCDPKGMRNEMDEDALNRNYFTDEIGTAGNLIYAPTGNNDYFFQKYYRRLLVVNGIDTETNGHDSGTRNTWSGRLAEGHPSFGALVSAATAYELPMAFITNGGFDYTAGLIAPTRVGSVNALSRIAWPNRIDPNNADGDLYHTPDTWQRILDTQADRLSQLRQEQHLPHINNSMSLLHNARTGDNELRRLTEFLPAELDNSGNGLRRQAQVAVAAFKAGVSVVANLNRGGFDTHGNHDASHVPSLEQLLEGVDFLVEEAERQGIVDRLIVAIGSDFGRTPSYNDGNGKDHWSITSMMFMGRGIVGNRVIGGTNERQEPITVSPDTLQPNDNGIRIQPAHIHREMRRLTGLDQNPVVQRFPISAEDLNIFG